MPHPKDDLRYGLLYDMRADAAEYGQTIKSVEAQINYIEARYELGEAFRESPLGRGIERLLKGLERTLRGKA